MQNKEYYINLRDRFLPNDLRLIIVAESPPASGKYFYDLIGRTSEPLFKAMMKDIIKYSPKDKPDGLRAFCDTGVFLVDAVYQPVNKGLSPSQRDQVILNNYPELKQDLLQIMPKKDFPILLIKANVCRLLESLLVRDGFSVRNKGRVVPFPSSGQQSRFMEIVKDILP